MEWTEIMARRDRVVQLLRPHLGQQVALERANDIVQALVFNAEDPAGTAARMLARDLEPRAAQIVGYQLGRAWRGPLPAPGQGDPRPASPGVARPRPRRETLIIGLWN